jgi:signal transduction histidine kinase
MTLTLRRRILLILLPQLVLTAVLGIAGVVLLFRLGDSINAILRENYDSVLAMERLREASERIDSSFQFALTGHVDKAYLQYQQSWEHYLDHLKIEQNNVTLTGEQELVNQLTTLSDKYRQLGDVFYNQLQPGKDRHQAYFNPGGLLETFLAIQDTSDVILRMNQANMEAANREARQTATASLIGFVIGLLAIVVLVGLLSWNTSRILLGPIRSVTEAAQGVAAGNLDQVIPYTSGDELGKLAQAFNTMANRLRDYRHSQGARLLRTQRTTQATIDSFPDPVVVVDSHGAVEMANPAARRLLGVIPVRESPPGQDGWRPPEPLRQPLVAALQGQQDYFPESFESTIVVGSGGQERTVLPRILTIRDPEGDLLGAAVVLQDVTRFRLLDEVKSNLVATVSHELKTPLTSIRLVIHLLLEETVGPLTAKQIELLLDARDNSERLLAMVNNLLNLARLEKGNTYLDLSPERPEDLLREAADAFHSQAQDKAIKLILDVAPDAPLVAADATRLGNALHNLLINALTYTDRGGQVTLAAGRQGDSVVLSVADTGRGIPPEYLPHVFEKFFRVPGQSAPGGTGLGLAIVQEIVTAHGGSVTCESQPGQGTAFRITLPAANKAEGKTTDAALVAKKEAGT